MENETVTHKSARTEAAKKRARNTARRNRAFQKLTPQEKRVAIAKDVIKALSTKQIRPMFGTYFDIPARLARKVQTRKVALEDVIPETSCTVCALGSLFVCGVNRGVEFQLQTDWCNEKVVLPSYNTMHGALKGVFSTSQLDDIEFEFEHRGHQRGATENMVAIMENIIRNDGRFVPSKAAV